MTIANSVDLFFDQLKDLTSATEQVTRTLPDLIGWATEEGLVGILESHLATSRHQLEEFHAIFDAHSRDVGKDPCKAIEGLIEGGNRHIEMAANATIRDILLIAHSLRLGCYLSTAAGFTAGFARSSALCREAETIAGAQEVDRYFMRQLAGQAAGLFGIEIGEMP